MHSRLRLSLAALTATALLGGLAACGGDKEPTEDSAPTSGEPTTAAEVAEDPPALWPLTGLEVKGSYPKHPVLVTKVDNTSSSAPQVGLGSADMVVEELVEGGMTRLAAFYYSKLPPVVGPVRSMRASDIGIVPVGAHVVTSGAAQITLDRVRKAGIPWVTEGAKGIYRETSRSAPYNLFSRPGEIAKGIKGGKAPKPYLDFGTPADFPGKKPARSLSAFFGGTRRAGPSRAASRVGSTSTPTAMPRTATSSRRPACWCCGSGSVTPAIATPRDIPCLRRSSRARVPHSSSTTARSSRRPGARTA
ncbi:DUF3048 domain-containing protein [Nocardioides piscis]|uniref:DUF3048 domain-containing protein n=1 Tax=Nocardioides piscis TaxID=2714938 RepID=A0A6G7YBN4_9ACTN|nr:DUF3048 domain-containing protein [Nocardioides piscis]